MKILSIDSGIQKIGFAIFDIVRKTPNYLHSGLIETKSSESLPERLCSISQKFHDIIKNENVEIVYFEQLFFNKNVTNAIAVAQAQGVMIERSAQTGAKVKFLTPLQVKQTIAGYGRADKKQILHMIKLLLPGQIATTQDDEIDAIAVGLTGARMLEFDSL